MDRKWMAIGAIAALVLIVGPVGCKKKPPEQPAPEMVEPPEVPMDDMGDDSMNHDMTANDEQWLMDEDLMNVTNEAYNQGLLGDIYYDFDEYDLRPEARERLARNAEFMRAHPEFVFTIEGHCDERGTNEYNLALGDRRGSAARNYVASLGIDSSRMSTISYGEERPQCMESTESCWQLNRRAHFVITGRG
ncbi:MAG: peptidoglycan-associated lipoprotein Pal [Thermoanaerobaculia bacterium]